MGRKKDYTEKALEKKVREYFNSISFRRQVQILYDTGRFNAKGYPVMAYKGAQNDNGEPIYERVYTQPPSMLSLCLFLDISKQTLSNYEKQGGSYEKIIAEARLRVEEYKQLQLNAGIKRPQGLIFDLQCNHGWSAEKKTDSGEGGGVIVLPEIERLEPPKEGSDE